MLQASLDNSGEVANFALLDQLAAIVWVKENIRAFGGDRDKITLVGHGTGANMVSMLMMSPVVRKGKERTFLLLYCHIFA